VPGAPVDEEARKRNGNLPGMGGVFNTVNLHLYHYAGPNPVKYTDPDGRAIWIPLVIFIACLSLAQDSLPPPRQVDTTRVDAALSSLDYGIPDPGALVLVIRISEVEIQRKPF